MMSVFQFLKNRIFIIYLGLALAWFVFQYFGLQVLNNRILILFLALILFLFSIWMALYKARKERKWLNFFLSAVLFVDLILNLATYSGLLKEYNHDINSGFGYFNETCAEFDSIRGFRWLPGEHRIMKANSQAIVYDNVFKVNNEGFYANIDYTYSKKDSTKTRYMVLGDSFTAAEFLDTPLVDYFNARSTNEEYFSFSINGGGLKNWHSIFFNEIVPNYEFDGLILNVFGNDLKRDFFMMHHLEKEGFTMYAENPPSSFEDYILNYHPKSDPYAPILSSDKMDSLETYIQKTSDKFIPNMYSIQLLVFSPILIYQKIKWNGFVNSIMLQKNEQIDMESIRSFYAEDRLAKLEEIIVYCKENNKQLIICSIPYEFAIYELKESRKLRELAYLEFLCKEFKCDYFNGYEVFLPLENKNIKKLFFPGDTHWTQEGSNLYGDSFLQFSKIKK